MSIKCLSCGSSNFSEERKRFSPEFKGEQISVVVPCMACQNCGAPLMDSKQMNMLRKATADKYRENHQLLTSEQIIAYREKLGMSQSEFANYLRVGIASVKRWETYYVQDSSTDHHIRLCCEEGVAEKNYINLHLRNQSVDIYSGNMRFKSERFQHVAHFLVSNTREDKVLLNKLHFYADFLHFQQHGKSITGARYTPLKYGPCPDEYKALYEAMVADGVLVACDPHHFEVTEASDYAHLEDSELNTLQQLVDTYHELGRDKIYELAHEEPGYKETEECEWISYDHANSLKLTTKDVP